MTRSDLWQWARCLLNATTYLGLAMIAAIWAGLLWDEHNSTQNFLSLTREHGKNLASAFEESVIRSVSEVDKTLLLLRARDLLDPEHFDIRRVAANPLYASDLVRNAALIDANGIMVNSGSSQAGQRFDLHDREHFQTFLKDPHDRLYIGRPIVGRAVRAPDHRRRRQLQGCDHARRRSGDAGPLLRDDRHRQRGPHYADRRRRLCARRQGRQPQYPRSETQSSALEVAPRRRFVLRASLRWRAAADHVP